MSRATFKNPRTSSSSNQKSSTFASSISSSSKTSSLDRTFAQLHHDGREGVKLSLVKSLQSRLPNEVSWALESLLVLSYEGLPLDEYPGLIDQLMEVASDFLLSKQVASLVAKAAAGAVPQEPLFYIPTTDGRLEEEYGLWLTRISAIIYNISSDTRNQLPLGSHSEMLNFVCRGLSSRYAGVISGNPVLSVLWEHSGSIVSACRDILVNISPYIVVSSFQDGGVFLTKTLLGWLRSEDRAEIVAALGTLSRLACHPANVTWIRGIENLVLPLLRDRLLCHDPRIMLVTLELFYQLTGRKDASTWMSSKSVCMRSLIALTKFSVDDLDDMASGETVYRLPGTGEDNNDFLVKKKQQDLWSFQATREIAKQWLEKNFDTTDQKTEGIKRTDLVTAYLMTHRDQPVLSDTALCQVLQETFPQVKPCCMKSTGRSIIYTGLATPSACPNKINPFHSCTAFCSQNWGPKPGTGKTPLKDFFPGATRVRPEGNESCLEWLEQGEPAPPKINDKRYTGGEFVCPNTECLKRYQQAVSLHFHLATSDCYLRTDTGKNVYPHTLTNMKRKFGDSDKMFMEKILQSLQPPNVYICRWKGCGRWFRNLGVLIRHAAQEHLDPTSSSEVTCQWEGCQLSFSSPRFTMMIQHMHEHLVRLPALNTSMPSVYTGEPKVIEHPETDSENSKNHPQNKRRRRTVIQTHSLVAESANGSEESTNIAPSIWAEEPLLGSTVAEGIRFGACLVLRNIASHVKSPSWLVSKEDQLVLTAIEDDSLSAIIFEILSKLKEGSK